MNTMAEPAIYEDADLIAAGFKPIQGQPPPAVPPIDNNLPRDDKGNSASSTNTPSSGAAAIEGKGLPEHIISSLVTDPSNPPLRDNNADASAAYNNNDSMAGVTGGIISDQAKNLAQAVRLAGSGYAQLAENPKEAMGKAAKGLAYLTGQTSPSPDFANGAPAINPASAIGPLPPPAGAQPSPTGSATPPPSIPTSIPVDPQPSPVQTPPAINPAQMVGNLSFPQGAQPQQASVPQRPSLWADLPGWRQAQLIQQDPTNPDPAGSYNQAVIAAHPGLVPASPDAMMQLASRGILPPQNGSDIDMGQAAQALNSRMQQFYGGSGTGGGMISTLADAQGIPYAKIMPIFNPTTGAMEMKQVDIPEPARNTMSGLPQGVVSAITDLGDKFASQELPKTFYGQIAPKYQSIVNLLDEAKKTGDYNQFRSMDVLNSYAGITRPGSVVRDSTIATDLEGSGLPNEVARNWEAFVRGKGVLSKKDLGQIATSAHDSYEGYRQQVNLAKRPALIQAHLRTGLDLQQLDQMMFPPSPGDPGYQGSGEAQGQQQAIQTATNPKTGEKMQLIQNQDGIQAWQPVK